MYNFFACFRRFWVGPSDKVRDLNFSDLYFTDSVYNMQMAGKPVAVLVKENFVPIFSICMGLHCSKTSEYEKGALVLQNSILHVGQITETERDKLIKRNMV